MHIVDPVPIGRTLSIMPTLQCTAACTHCGTFSNPREGTRLAEEHIDTAIRQAKDLGFNVVVFTGGEPTLAGDKLLRMIRLSRSLGLSTRIVTNAHWATTIRHARKQIARFIEVGLDEINYSTGDEHVRFVPFERIVHATRAALECNMHVSIMVEKVRERTVTRAMIEAHPAFKQVLADLPGTWVHINESPWMPTDPGQYADYDEGTVWNADNVEVAKGCDSVLTTTTIEADGSVRACCGLGMRLIPELRLGHVAEDDLATVIGRAENDFLKRWIRIEGPERILAWAARHDPAIEWENRYSHRCQACIRLYKDEAVRKVIRERYKEKIADVVFREWLLYQCPEADPAAALEPDEPHAAGLAP